MSSQVIAIASGSDKNLSFVFPVARAVGAGEVVVAQAFFRPGNPIEWVRDNKGNRYLLDDVWMVNKTTLCQNLSCKILYDLDPGDSITIRYQKPGVGKTAVFTSIGVQTVHDLAPGLRRERLTIDPGPNSQLPGTVLGDENVANPLLHTWKRGDTLPVLKRQLCRGGEAIDFSTATALKFNMRLASQTPFVGSAAVHANFSAESDGTDGWALFDPDDSAGCTGTTGAYVAEFEVTFADGHIETFPQLDFIAVTIVPDLDPGQTP